MVLRQGTGTVIGMSNIKQRRLNELTLSSHSGLRVGQCTPFYFCPRSIMLYLIHVRNVELTYIGGQGPIIHLEANLHLTVAWAQANNRRWALTLSNAGARYFEDRSDLANLHEVNWDAVQTNKWSGAGVSRSVKEGKQAEFLIETSFPWPLVERIGVQSPQIAPVVAAAMRGATHRPRVEFRPEWYY